MPIPEDDPLLDVDTERGLAASLFNLVWDLLDLPSRTPDEDELMANAAHPVSLGPRRRTRERGAG